MSANLTPPEVVEQWRAEFESELTKGYTTLAFNNGKYHNDHVQSLWEGFLLGRQTARIELPAWGSGTVFQKACAEFIESQGYQVRVKGE